MKTLFYKVLILSFLVSSCVFANRKDNDLKKMNLYGQVKTIKTESYHAIEEFGEISKGKKGTSFTTAPDSYSIFDTNGNLIEKTWIKSLGMVNSEITTNINMKTICKYDSNGNLINKKTYQNETPFEDFVYKYDNDGNLIEHNESGYQESIINTIFKYDNGILIERTINYANGNKETKKYDSKGNWIENVSTYSGSAYKTVKSNKYDDKGNLIEDLWHRDNGSVFMHCIYKYDNDNNLIEQKRYSDIENTGLKEVWNRKYDNNGNVIEENQFKPNEPLYGITEYKYEFDSKGNWIKRIESFEDGKKFIIEREIEYWN